MLVEFIGSTGAGKTTLIRQVQRRLAGTAQVSSSFDVMAAHLRLDTVSHPTAQNLIQELIGFPFFMCSLPRYGAFVIFILRMLVRHSKFSIYIINYLRALERTIGVFEATSRYARDRIILVDEGPLILAHNVFVYTDAVYPPADIAAFARLVPLPDLLVYVRAPMPTLITRTLERPDPPREMRSKDRLLIGKYVERATAVYEGLINTDELRNRTLIIENSDSSGKCNDMITNQVSRYILDHARSGRFACRPCIFGAESNGN